MQSAVLVWLGSRAGEVWHCCSREALVQRDTCGVGVILRVFRRCQELLTAALGRQCGGKEGLGHLECFQARLARALSDLMELWCPSLLRGGWTQ